MAKLVHITLPGWVGTNMQDPCLAAQTLIYFWTVVFSKNSGCASLRTSSMLRLRHAYAEYLLEHHPPARNLAAVWRGPVFAGSFPFWAAAVDAHWTAEELPAAREWGGQARTTKAAQPRQGG